MIRPAHIPLWIFFAVAALLLGLYFVFDPAQSLFAPKCFFHVITGWECPGCGMQRMIHALLHGDIAAAWSYNAFLLCILPLLALMIFAAAFRTRFKRLYMALNSVTMILVISFSMLVWGVIRNLI